MGRHRNTKPLKERFEECYDTRLPPWVCWPWQGPVNKTGHGVIASESPYKTYTARRVAYELYVRPFPQDRVKHYVLLTCDTVDCVNPAHMRLSRGRFRVQ